MRPARTNKNGLQINNRNHATKRAAKHAAKRGTARLFEALETRTMFANIAWDGGVGGNGTNFNDPVNWAGDVLPGAADVAVIGATGTNPNITIAGTPGVGSIQSSRNLQLSNATLNGTTIAMSGGANVLATSSGSTLTNVAITGGDLLLNTSSATVTLGGNTSFPAARMTANASTINMAPAYTLNSLIVAEGAAAGARNISVAVGGAGTVTFGPSAVVRLGAGSGGNLSLTNSSQGTIINNGLISAEAAGQTFTIQNTTLTNNGTLQATAGTLAVRPTNWTNPGSVTANGATLSLGGAWSNAGSISVNNSTLSLGGSFTTAGMNLANISRSGGTVNVTGTLDNTAATINLNATTGAWNMANGEIVGGSLAMSGGVNLFGTNLGGTLSNVAITGGDVLLNTTSAQITLAGATTFPAMRLSANATNVNMAPGSTLNSLVVAEGAAAGTRNMSLAFGGAGTVTFGPNAIVRLAGGAGGGFSITNSSQATVVSSGTITNESTNQTMTIQPTNFTNNGTLQATAGGTITLNPTNFTHTGTASTSNGSTLSIGGAWSSTGNISVNNATLNLGGTFSTGGFNFVGFSRTGGTVNLTGTLNNASSTLTLSSATGSWRMQNGTIEGGNVVANGANTIIATSSGGRLSNVALTGGDLLLNTSSANITLAGNTSFPAARLTANAANLNMAPGYVLNSLVVAEGAAAGTRNLTMAFGGVGTVTFGPNAIVRLASDCGGGFNFTDSSAATLVNNGLITNEATGRTLTLQMSAMTNSGTIQATAGTTNIQVSNWSNPGTISAASGTAVTFSNNWSSSGNISINNATLTLGGAFSTSGFNFGGFSRTGGTVNVSGTVNNTGSTLTLNAGTGNWNLSGGTINNGNVVSSGGSTLVFTSAGGTLSSVAFSGADLVLSNSSANVLLVGSTSFPSARLQGNNANLNLATGYVLDAPVFAEGAASGSRNITIAFGGVGSSTFGTNAIVKLASDCGGSFTISNSSTGTLVNDGQIINEATGKTLTIQTNGLTNTGTIAANAGTINVTSTTVSLGGTTSVANGALFHIGNAAGGSVVVESGADATVSRFRTESLTINGNVTLAPNGSANEVNIVESLVFGTNGKLDMNNNDLILDYADEAAISPKAAIQAFINAARNGGAWTGNGRITSTAAKNANPKITTLGVLESTEYKAMNGPQASFDNQAIDDTALLIKYTYYGDTDFNGQVNFDDYSRIDNGFSTGKSGWMNGDFDGNNVVNFDDYSLIDGAFNSQSGVLIQGGEAGSRPGPKQQFVSGGFGRIFAQRD